MHFVLHLMKQKHRKVKRVLRDLQKKKSDMLVQSSASNSLVYLLSSVWYKNNFSRTSNPSKSTHCFANAPQTNPVITNNQLLNIPPQASGFL